MIMDIEYAQKKLVESGIRPSRPRVAIYHYLLNVKTHPTNETIYNVLHKQIPTLSRTTVYNTVCLLEGANLIQRLFIEEGEVRYDALTCTHGHLKCSKCGGVSDVMLNEKFVKLLSEEKVNSFCSEQNESSPKIEKSHLYFYGTCAQCL